MCVNVWVFCVYVCVYDSFDVYVLALCARRIRCALLRSLRLLVVLPVHAAYPQVAATRSDASNGCLRVVRRAVNFGVGVR